MEERRLDKAPPFSLLDTRGVARRLDEFLQNGPVLLAFHRGTW
jgi:hypothetical protein